MAQDDLCFASAIALDSDRLAIGSPEEDATGVASVGAADVFKRTAGLFSHEQHLPSPKAQVGMHFGQALALNGGMWVGGAPQDRVSGSHSGSAWVDRLGKQKNGPWHFDTELGSSLGLVADNFGDAVALDDREAVTAARYTDPTSGRDSGELFLFHAAELVLTVHPTQPAAGANIDLDVTRGDPGDPLLLMVEAIDGAPLFVPILTDVFGSDHAWHAALDAPDPLFGVTVSVRAWKIGAGVARAPVAGKRLQ